MGSAVPVRAFLNSQGSTNRRRTTPGARTVPRAPTRPDAGGARRRSGRGVPRTGLTRELPVFSNSCGRGRRRRVHVRAARGAEQLEPRLFLAADLVAAYGFNEAAGTVLGDSSGAGNNGTINGATWAAGKNGGALTFNG